MLLGSWNYLRYPAKWWQFNPEYSEHIAFAMSADLLAEFGVGSTSAQPSNQSQQQNSRSKTNSLISDFETTGDSLSANPWGDLNASTVQTPQQTSNSGNYQAFQSDYLGNSGHRSPKYDDNVLFDASLETASNNDSDDWGEFESPEAPPSQGQSTCCSRASSQKWECGSFKEF